MPLLSATSSAQIGAAINKFTPRNVKMISSIKPPNSPIMLSIDIPIIIVIKQMR